ncbi:hypothetical protein L596_012502 [Steinernema carpocapsae]|uniref:Uncharacterized protein n=1 Tax=Steinernema carpocapsae TaxID=34508 RepID=A0A4U5NXK9_STECR|nr:hypothetical protein L596_012502 [Steinernema carpocapsae]
MMHTIRASKHCPLTACAVRVQILESKTELFWSDEFCRVFFEISGLVPREFDHLLVPWCGKLPGQKVEHRRIWWTGEDRLPDHSAKDDRTTPTLDVFFNRQLKAFHRRLTELLCRLKPEFVVAEMIKLAWYKAGYLEEHPAEFVTPEKFCFRFQNLDANCACGKWAVFDARIVCIIVASTTR